MKGPNHADERRCEEDDGEDITENSHLIYDPFVVRHETSIVERNAENGS
jgi:hypothetical protein